MKFLDRFFLRVVYLSILLIGPLACARAAEPPTPGAKTFSRKVTFELTFANRDLVWHGDPASPNALIYVKSGAQPIATDVCVTTLAESNDSPGRCYMREARISAENHSRVVYAFTKSREKVIGVVNKEDHFVPNDVYKDNRDLLPSWPADPSILAYDPKQNALYYNVELPGPQVTESLDHLPLDLTDPQGKAIAGQFSIDYASISGDKAKLPIVSLTLQNGGKPITLAKATLPKMFRRADAQLGSYDNKTGTYLPEFAYRAGAKESQDANPSVTFVFAGEFTPVVRSDKASLIVDAAPSADPPAAPSTTIKIDGNFDDWRNVTGVDDPRGDMVPYLDYSADVDLLEFKVANDNEHIYLYARVAGQVGRTARAGRSYFYAYMDVDQNPKTGFLPSRDDDCYYGVDIGDDCEVQFEFVDSVFRKAFYGFCGKGGDDNILKQIVTIGKSQYGKLDEQGKERADYKSEYTLRKGVTEITEDLKLGDSDTIQVAVSPDGHEVEVVSTLAGFLKDVHGRPTVDLGQTIDLAVGMERGGEPHAADARWAADSTAPIRGFKLRPVPPKRD